MTHRIYPRIITTLGLVTLAGNAWATDKVSSPSIEKDKLGIELRSGYDSDDSASKDEKRAYKLAVNYGVTDRLRPEIKAVLSDNPNQDAKITGWEAGLRWQFLKPDEAWLTAALDGNYKLNTQSGKSDKFELKLLLGKKIDKWDHLANLSLESELGEHSDDGLAVKAAWRTTYKINTHFAPGIELHGSTGNLRDDLDYNEQQYRLGPVATGKITDHLKYDVGYLWGISEAATDGRFKLILAYSYRF